MLDFLKISAKRTKDGTEIFPSFDLSKKSSDLMIRGSDFYAIWVEDRRIWSTDEIDAIQLIDRELMDFFRHEYKDKCVGENVRVKLLSDSSSGMIDAWHKYCQKQARDNYHMLDEKLIFSNDKVKKKDYASKQLAYPLEPGDISAYEKLISTLYSEKERHKIEWAIGSIVSGDSKTIQKFMVLYGAPGSGKGTIINLIEKLFDGYCAVFNAKDLGSSNNSFALEAFKSNPLVAIQHDGDLSRIEDNTRLNSLVSHETMLVNEKFKSAYANNFKCFLFMGTNKPVKITDGRSGLLRRLIDVEPSGNKLPSEEYKACVKEMEFELGAIASHCLEVYMTDPNYYDGYIPLAMMGASNDFYNYIIDSYSVFLKNNGTTAKAAWEMYKTYNEEAKVAYPLPLRAFKEELKNYFREFKERATAEDGTRIRNYYEGFRTDIFESEKNPEGEIPKTKPKLIEFGERESIFDRECADCLAQYGNSEETPRRAWDDVSTKLSDLDTSKLHYVRVPENHIVIDFDIKDKEGNKSFERNVEEASKWPATYAELSKSGAGVHLHYIYIGDPTKLGRIYAENVEVKVFTGKSSLRRKLTKCNELPIATISSGLPLKGEKNVINKDVVQTEKGLRTTLKKCMCKEVHPDTKSNVDFIFKILNDAYASGLHYDLSDMKNPVIAFAAQSTNSSKYCLDLVAKMHFKSDDISEPGKSDEGSPLVFFDCEVFPNLFLVNWKVAGEGKPVVRMINPKPEEIEQLLRFRLVGFNNRRYDNHMLYARLMGYTNDRLYELSQKIIGSDKGEQNKYLFGEAYNLSYTDVYDFAAKKQSLKKWEIKLGIKHLELGLPWDKPVPEELWPKVAEYCDWDVIATEKLFNNLEGDFLAREILADLAGGTVNETTNRLTQKIVFGKERHPQLVYVDLATGDASDGTHKDSNAFPGYEYLYSEEDKHYHNMYRGTDVGFGGYVYAETGIYGDVAVLDSQSHHPTSTIELNAFGDYTKNFKDILDARIYIKHGDFDSARKMLGGKLAPYLDDPTKAKQLAQALKIAINAVFGQTAANYDNPFRDNRNKNNQVALRGALFMRLLQDEINKRGYSTIHFKTDSVKIPDATPEIIQFVQDFGKKYGYTMEHECTYDKMCLVNGSTYIAKYAAKEKCTDLYGYVPEKNEEHSGEWTATAAQFAEPYVFKTLFTKEPLTFDDYCQTFEVKSALYLDMNETLPENEHDYRFVGKVGQFCPIKAGCGGGLLLRKSGVDENGENKYGFATGAKDFRWLESEMVRDVNEDAIDKSYFNRLVDAAIYGSGSGKQRKPGIADFGDFEWFASDEPYISIPFTGPAPWHTPSPPWEEDQTAFDVR